MIESMQALDSVKISAEKPIESRMKNSAAGKPSPSPFSDMLETEIYRPANEKNKPVDKKLMKACVEYESIFVAKMLKEMRQTVHKSEWLHGGRAEEIFEDMLYDEYAHNISKNSNLGLAKMVYDELSRKNSV